MPTPGRPIPGQPTAGQPTQISDIAGALARRWPILVAGAVAGLIVGLFAFLAMPAHYTATTTVSVNPMNDDPFSASANPTRSVSIPTEEQLVTSPSVAQVASRALSPAYSIGAKTLRDHVSVTSPDSSLVLVISYQGTSARQSAAAADAFAHAYLDTRQKTAEASVKKLAAAATAQIAAVDKQAAKATGSDDLHKQALVIQAQSLGTRLAQLANLDLMPGTIVGAASVPTGPSGPGAIPLGAAGIVLGLFVAVPVALARKDATRSDIAGIEGLAALGDQIVLDGTKDSDPSDTWDIAAFMLKIPAELGETEPFAIMVDSVTDGDGETAGEELVAALARRGRAVRYVDAGAINEGKISRGWPTERKRESWGGEVVVVDTSRIVSDANKVALATRSDAVLLARTTADDANALKRLTGLLRSKNVDVALTALFPAPDDTAVGTTR